MKQQAKTTTDEEMATMKVNKKIHQTLREMRGHNGCRTFDEVLMYLLKKRGIK